MSLGFCLTCDLWSLIATLSILVTFLRIIRGVFTVWAVNLDYFSLFVATLILRLVISFLVTAPLRAHITFITLAIVATWSLWILTVFVIAAVTLTPFSIWPRVGHLTRFLSVTFIAFGSFFRWLLRSLRCLFRSHFFLYFSSLLLEVADFFINICNFCMSIV